MLPTTPRHAARPSLPLLAVLVLGCGAAEGEADPAGAVDVPSTSAPGSAAPAASIDFVAVAEVLLERLELETGERVLLVGIPGRFDPLVPLLREGVREAGGEELGAVAVEGAAPDVWSTEFTRGLDGLEGDALAGALAGVDVGIMLPGATAAHPAYLAFQDVLRSGRGRAIHFHWGGAYGLDSEPLPVTPEVDAFYQRVLEQTDYAALAREQERFEAALRGSTVRVTTPAGTDLSFRVGDRPVNRQDGDASGGRARRARILVDREVELPAGVIRVAPLEESVHGTIAFPPTEWAGERVEGLVLTFEDGRVVDLSADRGLEAVQAVMEEIGPPARAFRELGLGFNPLLPVQRDGAEPWIPYFGYGDGVVRLSLGDNTELGGEVGGGWRRWNFFTDATLTVDGETWVEGGSTLR